MVIRHIIFILCMVISIIGCKKHPHQERENNICNNKNHTSSLYKREKDVSIRKGIEINIISGTWTDWKIFISKIFNRTQVQHNSEKRSYGIRFPWVRLSKTGASSITTNESSIYYSNIPDIMLYVQVRIEGDSSFLHRTQYVDGFSATWRNRFFLDLNKYSKSFITFEFVANLVDKKIPNRKKTYMIGSETVPVRSLSTESKIWKFDLKGGHLNILTTPINDYKYVKSTKHKWSDIFTLSFFQNSTYHIINSLDHHDPPREIIKLYNGNSNKLNSYKNYSYSLRQCYFSDINQDGVKDAVVLIVGDDTGGKAYTIPSYLYVIMNFGGHPVVMYSSYQGGSITGVSDNKIHITQNGPSIPTDNGFISQGRTFSLVYKNGKFQIENVRDYEQRH